LKYPEAREKISRGNSFEDFAEATQGEILDKELRDYNERIAYFFHNLPNWGKIEGENIISHSYSGPCGDKMTFFLRINNGIIQKAQFMTTGCGASVAAGAQMTILLKGKSVTCAEKIDAVMIDEALGGLPEDHKHCAELAARTLHQLLKKYAFQREPRYINNEH